MNLHIMPDSVYSIKFFEFITKHFPITDHNFILITKHNPPKYVRIYEKDNVIIFSAKKKQDLLKLLKNNAGIQNQFKMCDKVFLHSLGFFISLIVLKYAKPYNRLIWIPWGFDIYEDMNISLYDNETLKIIKHHKNNIMIKINHRKIIKPFKKKLINKLYCVAVDFKEEYDLIEKKYNMRAFYKRFHYPNPINYAETYIPQERNSKVFANTKYSQYIQIGNSGAPSNNHISILRLLNDIDSTDFGIICPLSYGDSEYIAQVLKIGVELFGERFLPVLEFLEPEKYFQLLDMVDIVIMNHNRQQGKGNIIPLIYMGKKVYLREQTATYKALISLGIKLGSVDSLYRDNMDEFFVPLTKEEKEINRRIIEKEYNDQENFKHMKILFDL